MIIYHYDPTTKEYAGRSDARLDPLESKKQGKDIYLLPAYATIEKPMDVPEGKMQLWNKDRWEVADIIIKPETEQPLPTNNKAEIDRASIPFIRSWIIKQADVPEELKILDQQYMEK